MAIFGLKYYAELRSKYKGVLWRVEISERGYAGPSEEMAFDGRYAVAKSRGRNGATSSTCPVKASEATINILCKENFHYLALFTSDPRYFRVSIFRNRQLYWRGYVTSDLYSENFTAPPYTVTIKAVDGFNLLSSIPFRDLVHIGTAGRRSLWELLSSCIDLLELDLDTADWMDLYAEGMDENCLSAPSNLYRPRTALLRLRGAYLSRHPRTMFASVRRTDLPVERRPCISAAPCRSTELPVP